MKKTSVAALILIVLLPFHATFAVEITGADLTASATPSTPEKPLTVLEKKLKAETDLRALEAQFRLFVTRTQLTIDRLAAKGVDTVSAQTELSISIAALNTAKANLDVLTKTILTDDMKEDAIEKAGVKATLTTIQDSLKDARIHLIESLTTLKTSVTLTVTQ